jgi:glycosyltransferase involved in cell wall biosynthesis
MKIIYVHKDINQTVNAGGINTVYLNHIIELSKLGHEIHAITSRDGEWDLNAKRHIVSKDKAKRNKEITKIIKEVNPDIVDVFSWGAELLDYVKTKHKEKVIMRADIPMKFYGKERLDEEMARECDAVISISKWCQFEWASVFGRDTIVIPHACDATIVRDKEKVPNSIVWIGKATDIKGFDLLLELPDAFFKNFQLIVVCAKTKFSDLNLFNQLEAKGVTIKENLPLEEYNELLSTTEFVLSTARKEGFCIAVLEAMRKGAIPVIPFWIGGTTDFVNNENGIIYNNLNDLYKKIKQVKNRKTFSKKAIETAITYNWKDIALQSLNYYEKVINNE